MLVICTRILCMEVQTVSEEEIGRSGRRPDIVKAEQIGCL